MSAPRSRWLRNPSTPEVLCSNSNGVVVQLKNWKTGERVKVELGFFQIDNFHKRVRDAAECEAKALESRAAGIRRNVYLPERKFADGGAA